MDKNSGSESNDKENFVSVMRDNIERWRQKRYEKLNSKLTRNLQKSADPKSCTVSPSILGMKCPKHIATSDKSSISECLPNRRPLGDLQRESKKFVCDAQFQPPKKVSKRPVVRETVTSKLRALQSNPLLCKNSSNNFNSSILNGTITVAQPKPSESSEAVFSTPAIGSGLPHFPDDMSMIKPLKYADSKTAHSKTFLKSEA